MKLVRLVYLRFYKALERVRPSPGSGGTELLTRGEVWTLRGGIFKHGVGCDKATNCRPGGVLRDHGRLGGLFWMQGVKGHLGTTDEM